MSGEREKGRVGERERQRPIHRLHTLILGKPKAFVRLVTWLCRVTQKQTALPSCWVQQSRWAVRCAAEPRNEFLEA